MPNAERMMLRCHSTCLTMLRAGSQRHQRMEETEGREIHAGMTQRGLFLGDGPQLVIPAAEAPAAQTIGGAAVQLLDQRAAPTGGQPGVGQAAADVLAHGGRDEMGVGAAARPENPVLFAIPVQPVGGVVVGLVHVLVDAEIQLDRRIARPGRHPDDRLGLGVRRDPQLAEFLDPVAAAGLLNVGLAATFRLHGDRAGP